MPALKSSKIKNGCLRMDEKKKRCSKSENKERKKNALLLLVSGFVLLLVLESGGRFEVCSQAKMLKVFFCKQKLSNPSFYEHISIKDVFLGNKSG